jgi:hypothetical protein
MLYIDSTVLSYDAIGRAQLSQHLLQQTDHNQHGLDIDGVKCMRALCTHTHMFIHYALLGTAGVVEGLKTQLKGLQPQLAAKAAEADALLRALAVEQKEALAAQVLH